jgi:hypothetical protein
MGNYTSRSTTFLISDSLMYVNAQRYIKEKVSSGQDDKVYS